MHMMWRTIWIFLTRRWMEKATVTDVTEYSMRVLPTDLDMLMHMNNGIYFSLMDFGRWNMVFRNGVYEVCKKKGWYPVVASEQIKFKKSLELWDKFTIQTKIVGYDEKNFFILQKFMCRGNLMATGLVKARFLKRSGGSVTPDEMVGEVKHDFQNNAGELSQDWLALEAKYMV